MSTPLKKLIVIGRNEYLRNYWQTQAFSLLDDPNCYFIATSEVSAPVLENHPRFLGKYYYGEKEMADHKLFVNVLMLAHRKRSKTFWFRYMRYLDELKREWWDILKHKPFYCLGKVWFNLSCYVLGMTPLYKPFTQNFIQNYPINKQISTAVEQVKPDLVIFPTSAVDEAGTDLLRLQEKLHYKTLYLVDNWDNLSSKSVFAIAPNYLGVWGQQSVEHAVEIHNIDAKTVTPIGTPRFQHYEAAIEDFKQGKGAASPYGNLDYLIFAGCSIGFDEISALKALDKLLIEVNQHRENPLKLVYRPHPWRGRRYCPDFFNAEEYTHTILDEQMKDCYKQGKGFSYMPNLNYYPALLGNTKGVIGPLTTMLFEAALFEKPIVALAYDDKVHYTSPDKALKYYRHFEGLDNIEGWQMSRTIEEMVAQTKALIEKLDSGTAVFNTELSRQQLQYYLYRNETPYPQRLKNLVDKITQEIKPEALASVTTV